MTPLKDFFEARDLLSDPNEVEALKPYLDISQVQNISKVLNISEALMSYQNISDPWWVNVTTLFYSGNPADALSAITKRYAGLCESPIDSVKQMSSALQDGPSYTMLVIAEILLCCNEYRSALQLYQYMTYEYQPHLRASIADCHCALGDHGKAIDELENIPKKSRGEYYTLGHAYVGTANLDRAEACLVKALQLEYISEIHTDVYYNSMFVYTESNDHVDLIGAASPEQRLGMIADNSDSIILIMNSLGDVYRKREEHSRAKAYYDKCQQFIYELYGEDAAVQPASRVLNSQGIYYHLMKC